MVIEVKTNFDKREEVHTAIDNRATAMSLSRYVSGVIFAFQSPKLPTVLKHLESYPNTLEDRHKPTAILLFDKGVIIHRWGWSRRRDIDAVPDTDSSAYGVRVARKDESAIVIAFLLLLFFQVLGEGGLYGTDAINTAMEMLDKYTERLADVRLGAIP